jgi:hypothetical protein
MVRHRNRAAAGRVNCNHRQHAMIPRDRRRDLSGDEPHRAALVATAYLAINLAINLAPHHEVRIAQRLAVEDAERFGLTVEDERVALGRHAHRRTTPDQQ